MTQFKLLGIRYRNRRPRDGLRSTLIAALYNIRVGCGLTPLLKNRTLSPHDFTSGLLTNSSSKFCRSSYYWL